ncbi:MAG: nucleotidyltransferase domain-containing protein [Nitrospirae bacterium]|nr:nucleotidyltransferase domain-containing protein [Nitrospirota bacterium]
MLLATANNDAGVTVSPVEIARELAEAIKRVVTDASIILFGSATGKKWQWDSDLDIYIEVPNGYEIESTRAQIDDMAWEVGHKHGVVIQTVVYTEDEVWNTPRRAAPFIKAIHSEGIVL